MNRKAATGTDKVTVQEYEKNLKRNVKNLVTSCKENRYRAKLVKRVFIPKTGSGQRPLGMPAT
ncbi:MAG: group II intron reverse transcriptase/maturase, partial [Leptospirales bacterium]